MTGARRVKAVRARALVRRWEYRQRNLAHGAWMRYRLALAHAREAFAIDEPTLRALQQEGFQSDDTGAGFEPARSIVWITAERARCLEGARALVLQLDGAMRAAQYLALVPFAG